jgi:hypothetical protein
MTSTMERDAAAPRRGLLLLQGAATAAALMVAAAPPVRGTMLVVPVGATAAAAALTPGTTILGRGWLPGSLVVSGDRATLLPHLLRHGALALAGPGLGCGDRA